MKHSIWLLMRHDGTLHEEWYENKTLAVQALDYLAECSESDGVTIIEATYETKE